MKVKDLMSRNVVSATQSTSFEKIWKIIFEKRVSGVPIIDHTKRLLGIISEEDLIEKLYPTHAEYFFDPSSRDFEEMEKNVADVIFLRAKGIMSKNVYTTTPNTPIMKAASSMLIHKVSCLPVVETRLKRKVLVGIICKGDIFGYLFKTKMRGRRRSSI